MKNRITHVLKDWSPELPPGITEARPVDRGPTRYPLPRGINMLMPVELCISRDLLITLLSASIQEMHRQREAGNSPLPEYALAELEAALQQHLAFRAWARQHPSSYISIAMYPTSEIDSGEDVDDLEDF